MCKGRELKPGQVAILGPCLLIVLIMGIVFAVQGNNLPLDQRVKGVVASQDCMQVCEEKQGCWYQGEVQLSFSWNGTDWLVPADPQAACGEDCCATLVADQTTVWIAIANNDPRDVASFSTTPPEQAYLLKTAAVLLFFEAVVFGVGLGLLSYAKRNQSTRRYVATFLILTNIVIVWSFLGAYFLKQAENEVHLLDIEGFVCRQACTENCLPDSGCYYEGTVDLCFIVNGTHWRTTATPQDVCGSDCCMTLFLEQTAVWIELNDNNPLDVANFFSTSTYIKGPYMAGATGMITLAVLLSIMLLIFLGSLVHTLIVT